MPDNPIEQYVRTMDLALFASNLAKQLPTLQYVGLSMVPAVSSIVLVGEYRMSPEVWRIFRAGGNSEEAVWLEPVTNDEGEEDQESFMYG